MLDILRVRVDNIDTMDKDENEKLLEKILKTDRKIRSFRIGIVVFSTVFFLAALAFSWIYFTTWKTESLVMAILTVFLTATSIHGYRQRLIQLGEEKNAFEKQLSESDEPSN